MTDVKLISLIDAQTIEKDLDVWELVKWNGITGDVAYKRGEATLTRARDGKWQVTIDAPEVSAALSYASAMCDSPRDAINLAYMDLNALIHDYTNMIRAVCHQPDPLITGGGL